MRSVARVRREELTFRCKAGFGEPEIEHRRGHRRIEPLQPYPAVDAVFEIALGANALGKLALPEEQDVEQFALRHVIVEQQAQRFEVLVAEILRFVDA